MPGYVYKRCTCPPRVDARGRKLACTKSHGSWNYKVNVSRPGGPRRQLVNGGFASKHDAEQALAEVVTMMARGQLVTVSKLSLNAYLDQWLQTIRPSLEIAAWSNYRTVLTRYVRGALGTIPLAVLTGPMLSTHYAQLLEGGGRNGRALSPTTVRTVHRVLNKALGDALRHDLIPANPVQRAVPPKRRRYEVTVWTAEQAVAFLTAARSDRLYAAWLIALACGLRRGELAGLRWRDLDLDRGTLGVTTQRTTDADYNIVVKAPKGTGAPSTSGRQR